MHLLYNFIVVLRGVNYNMALAYTRNMIIDFPAVYFDTRDEWRAWLDENGENFTDLWVGFYKKDSGKTGMSYEESVEEALCFGWIDGLTKRVDEASYKVRFTPRKSKSNWSAPNIKRVEMLIKSGKMTEQGLKHIEAAKADGRWAG